MADKFQWNDCIRVKETIHFVDGTEHVKGDTFAIKKNELAYFNHEQNSHLYELIDREVEGIDYPHRDDYR